MEGTVKFYNDRKGFGFIIGDDGFEYFYHMSEINEGHSPLKAEDRVRFVGVSGERGYKAKNIFLL